MSKLFWGYFLLFLDFSIRLSGGSLNLLPDWLGCTLLFLGCSEAGEESPLFAKLQKLCVALGTACAIGWALRFFGIIDLPFAVRWLLSSVCTTVLVWYLAGALRDMELRRSADLECGYLHTVCIAMAVSCGLYCLLLYFLPFLALYAALAAALTQLLFLVGLLKTRKAYRQMLEDMTHLGQV